MDIFDQISDRQSEIDKLADRIYDLEMVVTHLIDIVHDQMVVTDTEDSEITRLELLKLQKEWGKYK